ncbi:MAG: PLP-dependent aminotransferase family protein [Desulfurococcales archaeon]|nr:PLP-dependent aminotransferase family protein [Desulfurococcales archaeon]
MRDFAEIFDEIVREYGARGFLYPGAGGLPVLVGELRSYVSSDLGVSIRDHEDLVVVSGAQHGIKLLSQLLLGERDIVITEDPTFWEAIDPMRFQGARLIGIPVDEEGMDTSRLEDLLRKGVKPRLIYVIPTCHNPCGYVMSIDRRRHLLEIAEKYDLTILEDDPYRPIAQDPPPSLKSIDRDGRVIYVGSMSKVLAPGLRIGYVILDRVLAIELSKLEQHDFSTSTPMQLLVARALKKGLVRSLIPRLRRHYSEKIRILVESLEEHLPGSFTRARCGFFTIVRLGVDAEKHLPRAIASGVIYVPAKDFHIEKKPADTARISISMPSKEEIREGVERLASSIRG